MSFIVDFKDEAKQDLEKHKKSGAEENCPKNSETYFGMCRKSKNWNRKTRTTEIPRNRKME